MTARLLAIGDIHGCAAALEALLAAAAPTKDDLVVTLGDYVDRGPDSRGVVDRLLQLETECKLFPLLGNHEIMLLRAMQSPATEAFWLQYGGQATLASYGGSLRGIPPTHEEFFHRCLRHFETEKHLFVHANYDWRWSLEEQLDEVLFWTHLHLRPPKPHVSGKVAVVGHTPQPNRCVLRQKHLVGLDTGCCSGGVLSAMDLISGQIWQAEASGRLLSADEVAKNNRRRSASSWRKGWFRRPSPTPDIDG
jgi:serine/threonine protein phosphatase 1